MGSVSDDRCNFRLEADNLSEGNVRFGVEGSGMLSDMPEVDGPGMGVVPADDGPGMGVVSAEDGPGMGVVPADDGTGMGVVPADDGLGTTGPAGDGCGTSPDDLFTFAALTVFQIFLLGILLI